jgi:glucose/arabinose dehydrogenase/cytochrome c5
MRSSKTVLAAAIVFGAALTVHALAPQSTTASPQAAPAAGPAAPGTAAPQGRGGGRVNPTATLYTETCAGCHGTGLEGGRVASLFDDKWTHATDDESIAAVVANGIPNTEMVAFKSALTDTQIWQLVAYLRTQAGNLKEKPQYVADPNGQVIKTEKQTFKIDIVARNLETPWGLAFLPDGRLLITERPGRLRIVEKDGTLLPEAVKGTPKVWEKQDGGMLDVEVHPQYSRNGWIYLSYSETVPGYTPPPPAPVAPAAPPAPAPAPQVGRGRGGPPDPPSMTVVVRGKINKSNEWTDEQVIFRAKPEFYSSTNAHYGSRFIFDRQGHLFYTLGEKNAMTHAQDLADPLGKIHRVNDDGTVPKDNPFVNRAGAVPTIWSYGHRHPQGLAWDPVSGKLWESEHGPQGGDEINIIEPGHNYGWGVISMGIQPGITKRAETGMEQPVVYYTPTIAPSGIAFYPGTKYPGWKNNLFVAGLAGQQLRRLEITGDKVTHQEVLFNQFGRIRDVVVGPDGYLYVTMQLPGQSLSQSTPGVVARLVPVE